MINGIFFNNYTYNPLLPSIGAGLNNSSIFTFMNAQNNINMPLFTFSNIQMPFFSFFPSLNMPIFSSINLKNLLPSTSSVTNTNRQESATLTREEKTENNFEVSQPTGKHDLAWWKTQGYDEEMGKKLAQVAVRMCPGRANGQCVGYTRKAINELYGTKFTNAGAAYRFGTTILSRPELKGKFKKIDVKGLKNGEFPEGAIILWKPGTPGYTRGKAALYGHGAIVHNGKAYADCIVRNLATYAEVWIPVKA